MKNPNEEIEFLKLEIRNLRSDFRTLEDDNLSFIKKSSSSPKWYSFSNLTSGLAIAISIFTFIVTLYIDFEKQKNEKKLRIKEIVGRLTEINLMYFNAGPNLIPIQQITFAEAVALIEEAVNLADENPALLSSADYNSIIFMAFNSGRNHQLEQLFDLGLSNINDFNSEFGIRNVQADYFTIVKPDGLKVKEIRSIQLDKLSEYQQNEAQKRISKAQIYMNWSGNEYYLKETSKSDSLLNIAEMIMLEEIDESERSNINFINLIQQINARREILRQRGFRGNYRIPAFLLNQNTLQPNPIID